MILLRSGGEIFHQPGECIRFHFSQNISNNDSPKITKDLHDQTHRGVRKRKKRNRSLTPNESKAYKDELSRSQGLQNEITQTSIFSGLFIKLDVEGEADNEIKGVEPSADEIHLAAIDKRVVWDRFYRKCLHEGRCPREEQSYDRDQNPTDKSIFMMQRETTNDDRGQCKIRLEVDLCQKITHWRHLEREKSKKSEFFRRKFPSPRLWSFSVVPRSIGISLERYMLPRGEQRSNGSKTNFRQS
jgi:hypothetical protein